MKAKNILLILNLLIVITLKHSEIESNKIFNWFKNKKKIL